MSTPSTSASSGQGIFISYRRDDCQAQANGLYDGLGQRLPGARIFMDLDSIPAGVDFEDHIRKEIEGCDVVLVLIGDNWLDPRPGSSTRRIDEPEDFVRLEIESALENPRVRTIPVLVEGARMPDASTLPASIIKLARINAFELDDRRWKADLDRITQLLKGLGSEPAATPTIATTASQTLPPPPPTRAPTPTPSIYGGPPTGPALPPAPAWRGPSQGAPFVPTPKKGIDAGWVVAFLPIVCCGLLNFVPLLRSGLIRPAQRWQLIGAGIALEAVAIVGFALVGSAPKDSENSPTGPASTIGILALLLSTAVAVVLGVVFREPAKDQAAG